MRIYNDISRIMSCTTFFMLALFILATSFFEYNLSVLKLIIYIIALLIVVLSLLLSSVLRTSKILAYLLFGQKWNIDQ